MMILKYLKQVIAQNLGSIVIAFWVIASFSIVLTGTLLYIFFGDLMNFIILSTIGILLFPPVFLMVAGWFAKIFESYRAWKEGEKNYEKTSEA